MSEVPAEEQVVQKGLVKLADGHEKTPCIRSTPLLLLRCRGLA